MRPAATRDGRRTRIGTTHPVKNTVERERNSRALGASLDSKRIMILLTTARH